MAATTFIPACQNKQLRGEVRNNSNGSLLLCNPWLESQLFGKAAAGPGRCVLCFDALLGCRLSSSATWLDGGNGLESDNSATLYRMDG